MYGGGVRQLGREVAQRWSPVRQSDHELLIACSCFVLSFSDASSTPNRAGDLADTAWDGCKRFRAFSFRVLLALHRPHPLLCRVWHILRQPLEVLRADLLRRVGPVLRSVK